MGMFVKGVQSDLVDRLTLLAKSQKVIANNIANANVASYTAKRVDFSKVLKQENMQLELKRTNERHLSSKKGGGLAKSVEIKDTHQPVELDEEIVKMTETSMEYQAIVELLGNRFDLFNKIISGRVE